MRRESKAEGPISRDWTELSRRCPDPGELLARLHRRVVAPFAVQWGMSDAAYAAGFLVAAKAAAEASGADAGGEQGLLPMADRLLAGDADGFDTELEAFLAGRQDEDRGWRAARKIDLPELRENFALRRAETRCAEHRANVKPEWPQSSCGYVLMLNDVRKIRRDAVSRAFGGNPLNAEKIASQRMAAWRRSSVYPLR